MSVYAPNLEPMVASKCRTQEIFLDYYLVDLFYNGAKHKELYCCKIKPESESSWMI